jgi:hypothetical protein
MVAFIGKLKKDSKMKTYILFIFGMFDDMEDIEYFCTDILGSSPVVKSVKFVIENSQNIIVIFESEHNQRDLSTELYNLLTIDNVKFYFIFDRESIVTAHIPTELKDHIFKPINKDNMVINIDYHKNKPTMDLDDLLDKIEQFGIESLTIEEKNFLDNFEKQD